MHTIVTDGISDWKIYFFTPEDENIIVDLSNYVDKQKVKDNYKNDEVLDFCHSVALSFNLQWYDFRIFKDMNRTQNDRFGIYSSHEMEIRDIARKLKYSVDDILSAIQEVGFNEDEIEEYIRDRNDRSF